MGKPFANELQKIPETIAWATQAEVGPLTEFFLQCQNAPLICIGTGGSFTAAEFVRLLFEERGGIAVCHTPLSFLQSNTNFRNTNVVLFTAGGNNRDVLAVWRFATEREVRKILVVCGSPTSKIANLARDNTTTELFTYRLPAGKDGYLATNSLVAFLALTIRSFGYSLPEDHTINQKQTDNLLSQIERLPSHFVAIYSDWGRPAAVDLESKFSEAGLGSVMLADYRHFAHGRHNWIDKQGRETAIVAFQTPKYKISSDKLLEILPNSTPVLKLSTENIGPLGTLDLLLSVFQFTESIGRKRKIDPGRPGIPAYGSRLYRLGPYPGLRNKAHTLSPKKISIQRKLIERVSIGQSADIQEVTLAFERFKTLLENARYSAIVVDFDGTSIRPGARDEPLCPEIGSFFNRLLRQKIPIYFATGRGDSIHRHLVQSFNKALHGYVHICYYNGAFILPLSEAERFESQIPHYPCLDRIAEAIAAHPLLERSSSLKKTGCQLRIKANSTTAPSIMAKVVTEVVATVAAGEARVVESSHSVDVIPATVSKLKCIRAAYQGVANGCEVLAIGDRGAYPGNDFDFLTHPYSLSVDTVSTSVGSCWNLLPPGVRNVAGLACYASWIKVKKNGFTLSFPKSLSM